jgi:hypothetical protein
MSELSVGLDAGRVSVEVPQLQVVRWNFSWYAEKWSEEACAFVRKALGLDAKAAVSSEMLRKFIGKAEEDREIPGNLLLNEGIAEMLDLMAGEGSPTAFNQANARVGVGDSSTAAAATQTDLQAATNKTYKGMNGTYPTRTAQTMDWQADFTSGEANYAWQEWVIDNGAAAAKTLNRKVESLGTKSTGTWTLTGSVTIS